MQEQLNRVKFPFVYRRDIGTEKKDFQMTIGYASHLWVNFAGFLLYLERMTTFLSVNFLKKTEVL